MPEGTDPNASQDGKQTTDSTSGGGDTFKPITSQEDFEARLKDRLTRERSKFADYDDLKVKAQKFDEIDAANKTEAQLATERAEAAEKALADARSETLRLSIAAKHGITGDYLDLLSGADESELEAKAVKVAALIGEQRPGPIIPNQGETPKSNALDEKRTFLRDLTGRS